MTQPAPATAGTNASARIVQAAGRCLVREGAGGASMTTIANEAGVSKALLHYHFADRAALLGAVVAELGHGLAERERLVSATRAQAAAVDMLWSWVARELAGGELRALLELGLGREPAVIDASAAVRAARLESAIVTIRWLYRSLSLSLRVPEAIVAGAHVTFVNGLALEHVQPRDARDRFDVFWLGMLGVAD